MNECPICGGDRDKDLTHALAALRAVGKVGGTHNPGGYEFEFANGDSLQISGQCNACDEKRMLAYAMACAPSQENDIENLP